jgi:hypothetical protein
MKGYFANSASPIIHRQKQWETFKTQAPSSKKASNLNPEAPSSGVEIWMPKFLELVF